MRISTRVAAVGAAAAIAATSLVAMLPAGAAPAADPTTSSTSSTSGAPTTTVAGIKQVKSNVKGSLTVNATTALNLAVPAGSEFNGTFDQGTGAIEGKFTFPAGTVNDLDLSNIVPGAKGNLNYSLTSVGTATGTVDFGTNKVTLTDTESFTLQSLVLTEPAVLAGTKVPFDAGCVVTPINLTYTGTYDSATGGVDITSAAASLPTVPAGGCGMLATIDLTASVNGLLKGATATSHLTFVLGVETITPPAPTTTMAPKAPAAPAAPAATPTSGNPTFTG